MAEKEKVRTRFAPSPTGNPHIGHLRTALFSYAWAKHNSGDFVFRIEDTDRKRYVPESVQLLADVLKAYKLTYDEGPDIGGPHAPYIQSEKLDVYRKHAEDLVKKGYAYYCFCTSERLDKIREEAREKKEQPMYDRHCLTLSEEEVQTRIKEGEPYVIRLKVPRGEELKYTDVVMGEVKFNTDVVDDQILLKADGFPTYQLGVVVDDHEMGITHVTRGVEWISSTPKQILLYRAFGWNVPIFVHLPIFRSPQGGKLSKRKGAMSAFEYLAQGYLPEAVLNFIMFLGWAPKDDREIFSLEEFVKEFTLERINKSNPVANPEKLLWFNKKYISQLSDTDFVGRFLRWLKEYGSEESKKTYKDKTKLGKIVPLIKERVSTFAEVQSMIKFFYIESLDYSKIDLKGMSEGLEALKKAFDKPWKDHDDWEKRVRDAADEIEWKHGELFMALRLAIVGSKVSPPLRESMDILGYKECLERINNAFAESANK